MRTDHSLSVHLCSQWKLNVKSHSCTISHHLRGHQWYGNHAWETTTQTRALGLGCLGPGPCSLRLWFPLGPTSSELFTVREMWLPKLYYRQGCQALIWKPKQTFLLCHHPVLPKCPTPSLQAGGFSLEIPAESYLNFKQVGISLHHRF